MAENMPNWLEVSEFTIRQALFKHADTVYVKLLDEMILHYRNEIEKLSLQVSGLTKEHSER